MEVLEDYMKLLLDVGSTTWCRMTHLNTSKLFHKTLGISLVAREFTKYKDA